MLQVLALPICLNRSLLWYYRVNFDGYFMNDAPKNKNNRLELLKVEHRDLDDVINRLASDPAPNMLQLQRLKKRKLALKDQIARLKSGEIPDIIA